MKKCSSSLSLEIDALYPGSSECLRVWIAAQIAQGRETDLMVPYRSDNPDCMHAGTDSIGFFWTRATWRSFPAGEPCA